MPVTLRWIIKFRTNEQAAREWRRPGSDARISPRTGTGVRDMPRLWRESRRATRENGIVLA
jgi:hypothetical protein